MLLATAIVLKSPIPYHPIDRMKKVNLMSPMTMEIINISMAATITMIMMVVKIQQRRSSRKIWKLVSFEMVIFIGQKIATYQPPKNRHNYDNASD